MEENDKPYAGMEQYLLVEQMWNNPDCRMFDIHGNAAEPFQQELCRRYEELLDSYRWTPEVFSENGNVGLKDNIHGAILASPLYEGFGSLNSLLPYELDSLKPVSARKEGRWGLVSLKEKDRTLIPFIYDEPVEWLEGYGDFYKVCRNGKYGVVSIGMLQETAGGNCIWISDDVREILPCIADSIRFNRAINHPTYSVGGRTGLLDPLTAPIFEDIYTDESDICSPIIAVQDGREFYITPACIKVYRAHAHDSFFGRIVCRWTYTNISRLRRTGGLQHNNNRGTTDGENSQAEMD